MRSILRNTLTILIERIDEKNSSSVGKTLDKILVNIIIIWFKNKSLSRNFICCFSRLISNHYICNSHLHRINLKDSNLCDCGDFYEDIDHIVFVCSKYVLPRIESLKNIVNCIPGSVRDILGSKCPSILKLLFDFLNEISYIV